MIGSLRGTILDRQPTEVLLDVNGVGYRVLVSPSTMVLALSSIVPSRATTAGSSRCAERASAVSAI